VFYPLWTTEQVWVDYGPQCESLRLGPILIKRMHPELRRGVLHTGQARSLCPENTAEVYKTGGTVWNDGHMSTCDEQPLSKPQRRFMRPCSYPDIV